MKTRLITIRNLLLEVLDKKIHSMQDINKEEYIKFLKKVSFLISKEIQEVEGKIIEIKPKNGKLKEGKKWIGKFIHIGN